MLLMKRRIMIKSSPQYKYIRFADPVVQNICITNWSSDGIGLSYSDAAAVTSLGGVFKQNTSISSFDELQYFTSITNMPYYSNSIIGEFAGCTNLISICLPPNVTTLTSTFNGCTNLEYINLPSTITTLAGNAFQGCSKLAISVNLPNLTSISKYAFFGCSSITSITSLGSITSIPGGGANYDGTFRGCTSLTSVTLPSTLSSIGGSAFWGCTALTTINLANVQTIGRNAFELCTSLNNIDLSGAATIEQIAFRDCSSLTTVTHSGQGTFTVGNESFRRCPLSTSFPTLAIASIDSGYAFHRNEMSYIELNSTISSIGSRAFLRLSQVDTTIVMRNTTPPTLGNNQVFHYDNGAGSFYKNTLLKIYVPYSADHSVLNAYKTTGNWTTYADYIFELNQDGTIPS